MYKRRSSLTLKIAILSISLLFLISSPCFAFLYQISILDKAAISKLSDGKLEDAYIDVIVELQVSALFHQTSGFTPNEYNKHKNLLRYQIYLMQEMQKRKLDIPQLPRSDLGT